MQTEPWTRTMERVAVLPWPGIPDAFLCVSGRRRAGKADGPYWRRHDIIDPNLADAGLRNHEYDTEPLITFTVVNEEHGIAAEWDGDYGPIQLWFRDKDRAHEDAKPKPHWLWPVAYGLGHWSQRAVDEADLPRRFRAGKYEAIFAVLRQWVENRIPARLESPDA